MNLILRIVFIIILCICYKYIPVFEPKGINYLLSIFCLGFIGFELKKLWNSFTMNESKKNKIQKTAYLMLIILILISVILIIHKEYPAGNIRFIRGFIILTTIGIGAKIVGIIAKSSINSIIKNTALITFSTISFIAVIELIFMFISLSHGSGEAFSGKIWGNRYWNPINKLGFRDEEPKTGKNTVFFVGDSFTAGWGVKKIEDRFGEITTRELKKQGKTINEINLGRYGADTRLEYQVFESFIQKTSIKPNLVVLQYFVNDVDNLVPNNINCIESPIDTPNWKKILIEGSYLANYLNSIYPTQYNSPLPKECDYLEKLKIVYNSDTIWKKEVKQIDRFKNYCFKHKIKMTMIFFPFMEDISIAKKTGIEKRIVTYCKENKIKLFNVTDYIKNLTTRERQVSIMDSHASAKVHMIIGKNLAKQINI